MDTREVSFRYWDIGRSISLRIGIRRKLSFPTYVQKNVSRVLDFEIRDSLQTTFSNLFHARYFERIESHVIISCKRKKRKTESVSTVEEKKRNCEGFRVEYSRIRPVDPSRSSLSPSNYANRQRNSSFAGKSAQCRKETVFRRAATTNKASRLLTHESEGEIMPRQISGTERMLRVLQTHAEASSTYFHLAFLCH